MILHTVNKSPFEKNSLESCLRLAKKGSSVLLIEDGVYAAIKGTAVENQVTQGMADMKFYVLGPDLAARGLKEEKVIEGITVVDYGGFVDLTVEHSTVSAWL
jgi:tRNA 2-thiouridine synthesizing protein B